MPSPWSLQMYIDVHVHLLQLVVEGDVFFLSTQLLQYRKLLLLVLTNETGIDSRIF